MCFKSLFFGKTFVLFNYSTKFKSFEFDRPYQLERLAGISIEKVPEQNERPRKNCSKKRVINKNFH